MTLIKLISCLAHPYLDIAQELCNIDFDEQVLSKMVSLLRSNKVLFRVLGFEDSKEFPMKNRILSKFMNRSRAFETYHKYMLDLKKESLDIIAEFNKRSIKSVFIKSLNTLPLDSDNFDILVDEKDLSKSLNVLADSGFLPINWYHEPFKWLFRKVKSPRVAVHLHTAIAWHGIKFVDAKDLWKKYREKEINGVMVGFPSPEHHMLTTIAHAFFENRKFGLGDLVYLVQDMKEDDLDWNYVLNQTIHDNWFDSFYGLLQLVNHTYMVIFGNKLIPDETCELIAKEGKPRGSDLADKLIDQFDKKLLLPTKIPTTTIVLQLTKKILKTPHLSFPKKTKMIWYLINRFVKRKIPIYKRHPSFLVCFVGQDGTGKTTHANYVWKELKQISKELKVKYVWSRGFGYSFKPFLIVLKRLLRGKGSPGISHRNHAGRPTSLLKREPIKSLWACILITDHLLHLARVRLALSLGNIVICDRWIIDTLMDVECDLGKPLNEILERIVEGLVPRPEMSFIMDAETSELAKRRPEVSANLLEHKRYAYLTHSDRKGFQVIDTLNDLERNRSTILSSIIKGFLSQSK